MPLNADSELPGCRPTTLSLLPTPAAAIESKLCMDDLRGAFGGLSDSQHQLLVLREFEGLTYDEIGERLDMTRQMVESGLFRARRKLAGEYQELASGRRCHQVQLAIDAGTLSSARALGVRDRRRFARHLSHCQACRHVALQAEVDEALVKPRSIAAKIAALLPFPLSRLRWPGGRGRGAVRTASGGGSHHLAAASLQNAPVLAEQAGGSALALGPAAVAAAALTIAGVGGGLLHNAIASGHSARPVAPPTARHAARRHTGGTGGGHAASPAARLGKLGTAPGVSAVAGGRGLSRLGRASLAGGSSTRGPVPAPGPSSSGPGGRPATPSASSVTSATGLGSSAPRGALSSATAPVNRAASGVGSSAQTLGSTTQRVVAGAGNAVSKTVGGVVNGGSQAVGGVVSAGSKAVGGVVNA